MRCASLPDMDSLYAYELTCSSAWGHERQREASRWSCPSNFTITIYFCTSSDFAVLDMHSLCCWCWCYITRNFAVKYRVNDIKINDSYGSNRYKQFSASVFLTTSKPYVYLQWSSPPAHHRCEHSLIRKTAKEHMMDRVRTQRVAWTSSSSAATDKYEDKDYDPEDAGPWRVPMAALLSSLMPSGATRSGGNNDWRCYCQFSLIFTLHN